MQSRAVKGGALGNHDASIKTIEQIKNKNKKDLELTKRTALKDKLISTMSKTETDSLLTLICIKLEIADENGKML